MATIRNVYVGTTPILRVWKGTTKIFEYNDIDVTKPVVTSFTIPSIYYNLTIPITTFTASDNIAVTKYLITETADIPVILNPNWSSTPQTEYTFSSQGDKTLYAWVIDANNNISLSVNRNTLIRVAEANTYYVDIAGSDTTGTGAIYNPWATILKASQVVTTSGKTIQINKGTYNQNTTCSFALGVSVKGEGKDNTIIQTTYSGSLWSQALFVFSSGSFATGNQSVSGIKFNGMSYAGKRAITVSKRSGVTVHDCEFINLDHSPASWYGDAHDYYFIPDTWLTGNKFYNNIVTNCSVYSGSANQGVWWQGCDGFELYGNTITNLRGSGIDGDLIASNTNIRTKIHDNYFERSAYTLDYWSFAMELRWEYGDSEIYNNEIKGVIDIPWCYNVGGSYSWWIHDNVMGWDTLNNSMDIGIDMEADCEDILIEDNTFKHLCQGVMLSTSYGGQAIVFNNITIRNNIFENIGTATTFGGIQIGAINICPEPTASYDATLSNVYIYNNTMKGTTNARHGIRIGANGALSNIYIKNNIVTNFLTSPINVWKYDAGRLLTIDNLEIQYNNLYANGNSNNVLYSFTGTTNLTESNKTTVNPLFVSTTNFNLQSTSPMIDAGIDVGLPYNSTAPDLGALEYTA